LRTIFLFDMTVFWTTNTYLDRVLDIMDIMLFLDIVMFYFLILKYLTINMRMGVTRRMFELNIWGIILHVLMIIKEMKIGVTRGPTYLVII
jgi:hypothetical protein